MNIYEIYKEPKLDKNKEYKHWSLDFLIIGYVIELENKYYSLFSVAVYEVYEESELVFDSGIIKESIYFDEIKSKKPLNERKRVSIRLDNQLESIKIQKIEMVDNNIEDTFFNLVKKKTDDFILKNNKYIDSISGREYYEKRLIEKTINKVNEKNPDIRKLINNYIIIKKNSKKIEESLKEISTTKKSRKI